MNRWERRRLEELPWWKLLLIEAARFFLCLGVIALWAFLIWAGAQ